jgi:hypothetical protein
MPESGLLGPVVIRVAVAVVAALLLVYGAAGLSGHIVANDPCLPSVEGTDRWAETVWNPPGIECVSESSGRARRSQLSGTWPGFLGALAFGVTVIGLALGPRRTWLRPAAVTTLTFAFGGALAVEAGWQMMAVGLFYLGLPVAITADWGLRGGTGPWLKGFRTGAVAYVAAGVALIGDLFGFGGLAYGMTILLVAALAAVPWRRLPPRFATRVRA